jgi:hypothetical protein
MSTTVAEKMSLSNRELAEAQMHAAPQRAKRASSTAGLLGLALALHGLVLGTAPVAKAIVYGIVLFVFFFVNGASILRRSRWGYLFLAAFAALPLLGSLAYSFHLLSLFTSGRWQNDSRGVFSGLFGVVLTVLIIYLFRNLLSRTVLSYVWGEERSTVEAALRGRPTGEPSQTHQ